MTIKVTVTKVKMKVMIFSLKMQATVLNMQAKGVIGKTKAKEIKWKTKAKGVLHCVLKFTGQKIVPSRTILRWLTKARVKVP